MNPECRIASGALADVPQLLLLMRQYWSFEGIAPFDSARVSQSLEHLLSQPQLGAVWVARAGGDLVGYLIAVFLFSLEYQGLVAEIDEFFVSPHARGRGTGTALLRIAEASLADAGCGCIQLQLGTGNSTARAFYQGRGYAARAHYQLFGKPLAEASVGRVD